MKIQIAIAPKTLVNTNCPILPTAMATIPVIRRLGDKKKTLPPYSPNRLGVKTAQVSPQKTDSIASHKLIGSIGLIKRFHFTASKPQLSSMSKTTLASTSHISQTGKDAANDIKRFKSLLATSLAYINQNAKATMATFRQMDNIFLYWVVKFLLFVCANMLNIVVC